MSRYEIDFFSHSVVTSNIMGLMTLRFYYTFAKVFSDEITLPKKLDSFWAKYRTLEIMAIKNNCTGQFLWNLDHSYRKM